MRIGSVPILYPGPNTGKIIKKDLNLLTLIVLWRGGGGEQIEPCDAKTNEKFLCSHHNYTAFLGKISQFDTALVMKNTF